MEYQILHIEDSKTDADLVKRIIQKSGLDFKYCLASDRNEVTDALNLFEPNIILCDHSLPSFNSKMAYAVCKEKNPDLPFILVTGSISEELAVEMLKVGVDDYLLKTNLHRLPIAIEKAFLKKQNDKNMQLFRAELNQSETQLRTIFENSPVGLLLLDQDGFILELNDRTRYYSMICFGCDLEKKESLLKSIPEFRRDELQTKIEKSLKGEKIQFEAIYMQQDGSEMTFNLKLSPAISREGIISGICMTVEDITEQKKTQQKIAVINKEITDYKFALDQSSIVALTDQKGIIKYVNNNFLNISKYSREELIGQDHRIISSGYHSSSFIKNIWVTIANGRIWTGELKNKAKDGSTYWVDTTIVPFLDNKGKPYQYMAIRTDITERKKGEEDNKQLTERLQLATKSAQLGIWDWDIKNNVLTWDEGMYRLYNITANEFNSVYEGWFSRLHQEDREQVQDEIELALADKKEYNPEFRIVWRDSTVHYINASGIIEKDNEGNAIRMIGTNWDVTAEKEKERHLKLLESVITNTTDAVLITETEPFDEPGPRIVYVNDAFTKMTGYTSEEVIGKTPRILQGPKSDRAELKRLSEAIRRLESCEITTINYKKNGEEFWINFTLTPVANEKGWYTHWIAIERDVTDRKLAEIELNELNENLQNQTKELALSNAELEQFAFIASHDLQEPLRMITSFLTLLEKKYGEVIDDKGKTYIGFAVDGSKRMRQIILDLLEYSRVGRKEDEKEELDLNKLIDEIKILYRKTIEEKKAVISIAQLPKIYMYKAAMLQVFQNLISNALKYANEEIPAEIHITVKESEHHWQFAVIDNGIGIRKEFFDKIFVIFQRLHTQEKYPGTGMGLATVKKIIETHGGKIWVESDEGKGSAFYFTIKK